MTVAAQRKSGKPARPGAAKTGPLMPGVAKTKPEHFCDAVYWQMFQVESGRPDAELCLAATLLRAWLALEALPADSEPRQWLRNVSPVCAEMLESLRATRAADGSTVCAEE